MIKINRNKLEPPLFLKTNKYKEIINKLFKEKNDHSFSSYTIKRICKGLKRLYHYKCCYCETHIAAGTVLEYDHFRPKNGIKGTSHPGYYWLGYEWTNLLPACPNCNRAKSNAFPISGKRLDVSAFTGQWTPAEEPKFRPDSPLFKEEKPLLLHPETDTPEDHLVFLGTGEVTGTSPKGRKTIEICKLNRDGLLLARAGIIDNFLADIREMLNDFISGSIDRDTLAYGMDRLFTRISKCREPGNAYSAMGLFLYNRFDSFFIEKLSPKQQKVLRKAFNLFKNLGSCRKPSPAP